MDPEDWIALGSVVVALTAVIIGPLVSLKVAKRQIHADVVLANRQAWINAVRNDLAELLGLVFDLGVAADKVGSDWMEKYSSAMARTVFLRARLQLLLNPKEPEHQRIIEVAREVVRIGSSPKADIQQLTAVREELAEAAQVVLKTEWNRVKAGE